MLIYNLYPLLAGPLVDWPSHLKRAAAMGFEWVYVNPIHMPGRSGSIYSVADYFQINPLLLNINDSRSGEDQFCEITGYAKKLGLRMMVDLVLSHCAVDSPLTRSHPEWFTKRPNDQVAQPFYSDNGEIAIWTDLAKFAHTEFSYNAGFYSFALEIAEYLFSLGFDGFRCDAAYQVPASFWARFIQDVRRKYPSCIFVAETLGCPISDVKQTASSGFDFVYNSAKWWDYESLWLLQQHDLLLNSDPFVPTVSFPEDHDTERLYGLYDGVQLGINAVKQRSLFTAFFSTAWLIPIGFEFGFSKRISVSRTRASDWEPANIDIQAFIARIIEIKKRYAVLGEDGPIRVLSSPNPNILVLWKATKNATEEGLLILNKDIHNPQYFEVDNLGPYVQFAKELIDISPESSFNVVALEHFSRELGPGQSLILVGGSKEYQAREFYPDDHEVGSEVSLSQEDQPRVREKPAFSHYQSQKETPHETRETNNNNDSLCVMPWIHTFIAPSGHVRLCCVSGSGQTLPPSLGSIRDESLNSIFISERMHNIRTKMLSGLWPDECSYCRAKEARGIQSSRQVHNEIHEPYYLALVAKRRQFTPTLRSIDLRIDNTCNFKCRSCSGFCSTRWFDDHNVVYPSNPVESKHISLSKCSEFYQELYKLVLEGTERIHFAGGEPLVSHEHYALLDHLVDFNRFGVELYYDTNMSYLEFLGRDIIKLWDLFPNVTVSLSLDGVGKQGEYIRYGLNFEQWCRNVNRLRNELPHVKRKLHFVVSVFNIMNLSEHLYAIIDNGFVKADLIRLTFLEWPAYLNVQILPDHLKKICVSRLKTFIDDVRSISTSTALEFQLKGLVEYLGERDIQQALIEEFAIKTVQIDSLRGESALEIFPEISELFQGYLK
jgi:starch synthase (maltosyl-transferring)